MLYFSSVDVVVRSYAPDKSTKAASVLLLVNDVT